MIIKICSMLLSLRISSQKFTETVTSHHNIGVVSKRSCIFTHETKKSIIKICVVFIDIFSGVSCDSCLKNNFRGRRYKCLICIDYDLCAACYESGATTNQHTTEHPMQCILSRSDFGKLSPSDDTHNSPKPVQ